jgi:predicted transcriptional regulator
VKSKKKDKPEMTKTTIRLPKDLKRDAQIRALNEDRNFQDIVADALKIYLKIKPKNKEG